MKIRSSIIIFMSLFLIFTFGCAQKIKVYKDGYPLPRNSYYSKNIQTKMEVFANVAKYYEKSDKEGNYLYPEWLEVGKSYGTFRNKPKYVGGTLKVNNPRQIKYSVILVRTKNGKDKILFNGSRPRNIINFKEEYKEEDKNSEIRILICKGHVGDLSEINSKHRLFTFDFIRYNMKQM